MPDIKSAAKKSLARIGMHNRQLIYSRTYGACLYLGASRENIAITDKADSVRIHLIFSRRGDEDIVSVPRDDILHIHKRDELLRAIEALQGKAGALSLVADKSRPKIFQSADLVQIAGQTRALYNWMRSNGFTINSSGQAPDDFRRGLDLISNVATTLVARSGIERTPSTLLPLNEKMRKRFIAILVGHLTDFKPEHFLSFDAKTDARVETAIVAAIAGNTVTTTARVTNGSKTQRAKNTETPTPASEVSPTITAAPIASAPDLHIVYAIEPMSEMTTTIARRSPEQVYAELRAAGAKAAKFVPRDGPYIYPTHPWSLDAEGKPADPQKRTEKPSLVASQLRA